MLSQMSHDSEALRRRRATGIILCVNGISVQNLPKERFSFSVGGGGGQGTVFSLVLSAVSSKIVTLILEKSLTLIFLSDVVYKTIL